MASTQLAIIDEEIGDEAAENVIEEKVNISFELNPLPNFYFIIK
jgi:hypothetical protein